MRINLESQCVVGNGRSESDTRIRRTREARWRGRGVDNMGRSRGRRITAGGFQFAQEEATVPGTDGRAFHSITCSRCLKKGHFADMYPSNEASAAIHNIMSDIIQINEEVGDEDNASHTHEGVSKDNMENSD